jgi:glycosyltransferase involved in cell wall biosynthesis
MLRQLVLDGWVCHVVMPGESPLADEFRSAGCVLHTVPMRRITRSGSLSYWAAYVVHWPVTVLRLRRIAREIDADVIHSNSLHSWYGWAAAALLRIPHVWHAREIVVQSASALRVERWLCRHFAVLVIAVSRAVASQLTGANVVVIRDLPDTNEFCPRRAGRFRAERGIDDAVPLLGACGRIDTWKGFDVVLAAMARIRDFRPDAELVIAGGAVPGKQQYFEGLAQQASMMPGVHWLGPTGGMPDLLADLDVFLLASTEPEPFATVLMEALASGVSAVATDNGGSPEIMANVPDQRGRLVPAGDSTALADAAIDLAPPGPSSAESRRNRSALLLCEPGQFGNVFREVVDEAPPRRINPRGRWGLGRTNPRASV